MNPSARPEIGAQLDHLCIESPDPKRLGAFFERIYNMRVSNLPGGFVLCEAPGRRVLIAAGVANQVSFFGYAFADARSLERCRAAALARGALAIASPSPVFGADAFAVRDPDGRIAVFGVRAPEASVVEALPGRLQHVVFRSTNLDQLVDFYSTVMGFLVSDRVQDEAGTLRACFLRTDIEHHSLALFRSPESRLDHFSFETTDWEHIRRWADDFSVKRMPIFWGVGRHGPGNDLFFMVKDPDDNLVEVSAEIEQCPADRPMGIWPHEQRTLNVWGNAIMRS
jgi:catechol 2,3-dioxygenase-like lactoylglutathione lyase family enzyme